MACRRGGSGRGYECEDDDEMVFGLARSPTLKSANGCKEEDCEACGDEERDEAEGTCARIPDAMSIYLLLTYREIYSGGREDVEVAYYVARQRHGRDVHARNAQY